MALIEVPDLTPADETAFRVDCYRVSVVLIREAGLIPEADPDDVLELARYLAGARL